MKKLLVPAVAVAGVVVSSLSFASAAPMMQPVSTFTGFYTGLDFGFRNVNTEIQHTRSGVFADSGTINNSITQSTEGLHVGYGYEFANNLYLGAKAFAFIAQGRDRSETTFGDGFTFDHQLTYGTLYGANAQLGYAITPRFMPYLTGGWEALNVQNRVSHQEGIEDFSTDKYVNGPDVGVGMNVKVADNWLVNAEFTGAYFNNTSKTVGVNTVKLTPYVYTGTVGLSYLFA